MKIAAQPKTPSNPASSAGQFVGRSQSPLTAPGQPDVLDAPTQLKRASQLGHRFEQAEFAPESLQPATSGQPLPKSLREKMESAFNTDFSDVRVHEDENAETIGATAYTQGHRLHFAPGTYRPYSTEGQKLIGHELAHVIQQRSRRVTTFANQVSPINTDPYLEAEADTLGKQALESNRLDPPSPGQFERSLTSAAAPIQAAGLFRKKAPPPKPVQNQAIKFTDTDLDPKHPPQDKFAGGAINQVDRVTYTTPIGKTMTTGYFKEDKVPTSKDFGERPLDQYKQPIDVGTAAESTGVTLDDPRLANRAVATSRYAQLLKSKQGGGPGNTIATTEFATHGNKYGSVSEEAPGKPLKQGINEEVVEPAVLKNLQGEHGRSYMVDDATGKEIIRPGNPQKAAHPSTPTVMEDPSKFYRLNTDDYYRNVNFKNPATQKGLSDLQIMDALTGQVDRHGGNVHIDDSGNVMGIDHDAAFGKHAIDPTKLKSTGQLNDSMKGSRNYGLPPLVDAETARMVKHLKEDDVRKQLTGLLTDDEIEASVSRLAVVKKHVKNLKRSGGIVGRQAKFYEKAHPQSWDDSTYKTLTTPENRERSYLGHFVDSYEKAAQKGSRYAESPSDATNNAPVNPVSTAIPSSLNDDTFNAAIESEAKQPSSSDSSKQEDTNFSVETRNHQESREETRIDPELEIAIANSLKAPNRLNLGMEGNPIRSSHDFEDSGSKPIEPLPQTQHRAKKQVQFAEQPMVKEFQKNEPISPPPETLSNLENKQETDLSIAPLKPLPLNANKPKSKYQLAREKEEQRRQNWEKNRQIREEREKEFKKSTTHDFFAGERRLDKDSKSKKS